MQLFKKTFTAIHVPLITLIIAIFIITSLLFAWLSLNMCPPGVSREQVYSSLSWTRRFCKYDYCCQAAFHLTSMQKTNYVLKTHVIRDFTNSENFRLIHFSLHHNLCSSFSSAVNTVHICNLTHVLVASY